jgi:hypothetical protein
LRLRRLGETHTGVRLSVVLWRRRIVARLTLLVMGIRVLWLKIHRILLVVSLKGALMVR